MALIVLVYPIMTTFYDLPSDIRKKILMQLSPKDIKNCRLANKSLNVLDDEYVKMNACLYHTGLFQFVKHFDNRHVLPIIINQLNNMNRSEYIISNKFINYMLFDYDRKLYYIENEIINHDLHEHNREFIIKKLGIEYNTKLNNDAIVKLLFIVCCEQLYDIYNYEINERIFCIGFEISCLYNSVEVVKWLYEMNPEICHGLLNNPFLPTTDPHEMTANNLFAQCILNSNDEIKEYVYQIISIHKLFDMQTFDNACTIKSLGLVAVHYKYYLFHSLVKNNLKGLKLLFQILKEHSITYDVDVVYMMVHHNYKYQINYCANYENNNIGKYFYNSMSLSFDMEPNETIQNWIDDDDKNNTTYSDNTKRTALSYMYNGIASLMIMVIVPKAIKYILKF